MLTAGTLGVTAGTTLLACGLPAAVPDDAEEGVFSEVGQGLGSRDGVTEDAGAGVRTGVSEPDCPSLPSA